MIMKHEGKQAASPSKCVQGPFRTSCPPAKAVSCFSCFHHPRSPSSDRFAPRWASMCWHSIVSVAVAICFHLSDCGPSLSPHPSATRALSLSFPEIQTSRPTTAEHIKSFTVSVQHFGIQLLGDHGEVPKLDKVGVTKEPTMKGKDKAREEH